jgi:hypothetical protein
LRTTGAVRRRRIGEDDFTTTTVGRGVVRHDRFAHTAGGRRDRPPTVAARRLRASLGEALRRHDAVRALREALRLGEFVEGALGRLAAGFEALAADGAERAEYGFDRGLAAFADLVAWAERGWIGVEEAFVAAAHPIAEPSLHLPPGARPAPRPNPPTRSTPPA